MAKGEVIFSSPQVFFPALTQIIFATKKTCYHQFHRATAVLAQFACRPM
jgi:hypothetical protein